MKSAPGKERNGDSILIWVASATALLLLVPLIAMQFTQQVNWDAMDFAVMGALLFSAISLFVLVGRRCPRNRRFIVGAIIAAMFVYIWAELAVGVFANRGI